MLPTYFVMLSRTIARFKREKRISIVLIRGKTRTGTSNGMLWGRFGVCLVFLGKKLVIRPMKGVLGDASQQAPQPR